MKRMLFSGALAIVLSATSLAAAGKGQTTASIILNNPLALAGGAAAAWEPKLGDSVSFTTVYPSSLDRYSMSIQVLCYQNGSLVFVTAGLADRSFVLGGVGSPWRDNGGAATCHADLYYWSTNGQKFNQIATTEFNASGF